MSGDIAAHIRKEVLTNGSSNAVFNGLAAWALLKDTEWMPMWGEPSIAVDITATSAILLFIVALIMIPLNRSKKRKGKAPEFRWDNSKVLHRFFQRFPRGLIARAFCFAALGIVVVAPVSFVPYIVLGVEGMTGSAYAVAKGVWAGIMAGIMCIPMIQMGLADVDEAPSK
jgi:hypothetical protein